MHDAQLMMNLYKLLADGKLDRQKFFQMLVRAVTQELGCSRASVWLYQGALKDSLVAESQYDAADAAWGNGLVLHEDEHPDYFEAIRDRQLVVASDARNAVATLSFLDGYLEPLNIYSLLDASIQVNGSSVGVLCCEQTVHIRDWADIDTLFAQKVAGMIGLAFQKQVLA